MSKPTFTKRVGNFTLNNLNKLWLTRRLAFKTRSILGYEFYSRPQVTLEKQIFGSKYGGHCVALNKLNDSSIIYSLGLGYDITFDEALINQYGLQVHGFDPTPKSIEYLESISLPQGFHLHKYGISNLDGIQTFHMPINPEHVSHSTTNHGQTLVDTVDVKMQTLSTTMKQLGHTKIDLLKMDIEGSEYVVIDEICDKQILVDQILIEFHHHFEGTSVSHTKEAVKRLNQSGYKIFNVSPNGHEVSFIRQ
tara:strand:+ start:478 stop:1227 length:750 start_codon:yes stop_codon:yes gene_type:complete